MNPRTLLLLLLVALLPGCATTLSNPTPSKAQTQSEKALQEAAARKYKQDLNDRLARVATKVNASAEEVCVESPELLKKHKSCAFPFEILFESSDINAYATGHKIVITLGMMEFIQGDEELALVVGHELAHNILYHNSHKKAAAVGGAVGGGMADIGLALLGVNTGGAFARAAAQAAAQARAKEFEASSDYLGLYLSHRAGYSVEDVENFWRRMAARQPKGNVDFYGRTHPINAARAVALGLAREELLAKEAAGEPLIPNLK